jgi:hypothetical protein
MKTTTKNNRDNKASKKQLKAKRSRTVTKASKFFSDVSIAENMRTMDSFTAVEIITSHFPKMIVSLSTQGTILLASMLMKLKLVDAATRSGWMEVLMNDETDLKNLIMDLLDYLAHKWNSLFTDKKEQKVLDKLYEFEQNLDNKTRTKFITKANKKALANNSHIREEKLILMNKMKGDKK